ncbi:MAG: hypothetical protein QHH00_01205 [Methanomassiliicoccales archaeon]|jgi:hypothetical protein|nr:hypothetical protein [Methanomassiliicoccales archaeon]
MKQRFIEISIFVALVCVLSVSVPSVVSAQAEAPEWQEGDRWAIGSEYNFTPDLQDVQSDLEDLLSQANVTLTRFDVEGTGGFWVLWEVTDVTNTEYLVTIKVGAKMASELHIAVEGSLPSAGTYDVGNPAIWILSGMPGVPKQHKEISLDFDEDFAIFSMGELTLDKETLAIKTIDWQIKSSSIIDLEAKNIPSLEAEGSNVTISYDNYDISVRFNLNANIDIEFGPYLDIYQFPFDTGDSWSVDSTAVVSGTIDGFLDIQGLPDEVEEEIFSEEFVERTGIADFPIEFDKLTIEDGDVNIHDGVIESFEVPIHLELHCIEKRNIQLGNFGTIEVYVIKVNDGRERIYYSTGIKFLAKATTELSFIEMPSEIPYDPFQGTEVEATLAEPEMAESQLEQIESYEASISDEVTGGGSGGLSNWAALLVIAIVIAAAFIVVILVFTRRKRT